MRRRGGRGARNACGRTGRYAVRCPRPRRGARVLDGGARVLDGVEHVRRVLGEGAVRTTRAWASGISWSSRARSSGPGCARLRSLRLPAQRRRERTRRCEPVCGVLRGTPRHKLRPRPRAHNATTPWRVARRGARRATAAKRKHPRPPFCTRPQPPGIAAASDGAQHGGARHDGRVGMRTAASRSQR